MFALMNTASLLWKTMHTKKTLTALLKIDRWTANELAEHFQCHPENIRYHLRKLEGAKTQRVKVEQPDGSVRWALQWWIEG
jgi:predicted ArsR family transcriptional regulator